MLPLHHNKKGQTHGVAVTLLILVQSSGVRIPVGLLNQTVICSFIADYGFLF